MYEQVRLPVLQQWAREHDRPYFWAGEGRGAEECQWKMAVAAEASGALRVSAVAPMLDLWKAFECIEHKRLIEAAAKYKLHPRCLRVILGIYRAQRYLLVDGVTLEHPMTAQRGAVAGSKWAMYLLRLLLIVPLIRTWPGTRLAPGPFTWMTGPCS